MSLKSTDHNQVFENLSVLKNVYYFFLWFVNQKFIHMSVETCWMYFSVQCFYSCMLLIFTDGSIHHFMLLEMLKNFNNQVFWLPWNTYEQKTGPSLDAIVVWNILNLNFCSRTHRQFLLCCFLLCSDFSWRSKQPPCSPSPAAPVVL